MDSDHAYRFYELQILVTRMRKEKWSVNYWDIGNEFDISVFLQFLSNGT